MFVPFFLKRKKNYPVVALLGGSVEYHPQLEKIAYIQPGKIRIIPCKDLRDASKLPGVPFDIEALLFSLEKVQPENCILGHLLNEVDTAHTEHPVFFCSGSQSKEGIPFLQIPPSPGEPLIIGTVRAEDPLFTKNGYHLFYDAA